MIRKKAIFVIIPLLLVLLAVGLSFTDNKENAEVRVQLVAVDPANLAGIRFENPKENWQLVNNDGWKVENSDKTDATTVEKILDTLTDIDGKLIDEEVSDVKYGLTPPEATVTLIEKNGKETVLSVGNKTPAGTEYYIADADGKVYTIYTEKGNVLKSKRYQAEDSFILGVEYVNLHRIEVGGKKPFALTKGEETWSFVCGDYREEIPVELIKSGVTRHFGAIYALTTMKATEETKANCGLSEPGDTVTVIPYSGESYTIHLGNKEGDRIFIMVEGREEIYSVIADYFNFIQLYRESA